MGYQLFSTRDMSAGSANDRKCRSCRLNRYPVDGRNRRILVIAGRSGEGPLTEPTAAARPWHREPLAFAGHHHRVLLSNDLRPGQPPEGKLDGGEGHEGGQGSARLSKSLATRRFPRTRRRCARLGARRHDEAPRIVAPLDDLHAQQRHLCHRSVNLPSRACKLSGDACPPRLGMRLGPVMLAPCVAAPVSPPMSVRSSWSSRSRTIVC